MVDRVEITVIGGDGGHGASSFRREKFVPFGGPDGGDGGSGGNVMLVTDSAVNSLRWFRRRRRFAAEKGGNGGSKKRHGSKGENLLLLVPVGTVVYQKGDGDNVLLADMEKEGQRVMVARGGEGGLGNTHFATSTNQAPRIAQRGEAGEGCSLVLELKLIAEEGIIGYPSVGKSTLLAAASAAKPEVGSYPFTTCEPVLGVAEVGQRRLVMAEVPGLIEDAHLGRGLGHDFLRHAERCKVLIHLLDGTSPSPIEDMRRVNKELALFKPSLGRKMQIVAINKIDLPDVWARLPRLRRELALPGTPVFFISAMTKQGVPELIAEAARLADSVSVERETMEAPVAVFRPEPKDGGISVSKEGDTFLVVAPRLARTISRIDLSNPEGRAWLKRQLAMLGVAGALKRVGVKVGDRVCCGGVEWEWE